MQETFELTFTHDSEQYGQLISRDLKPGGKEVAVTNENRAEYVELYVNHIVNTLPKKEIAEFVRGFKMVMDGQVRILECIRIINSISIRLEFDLIRFVIFVSRRSSCSRRTSWS